MQVITIKLREYTEECGINLATMQPNLNYRVEYSYWVDGEPFIGKNGIGDDFHMLGVSSSTSWALQDAIESGFYTKQLDEKFPNGWTADFTDHTKESLRRCTQSKSAQRKALSMMRARSNTADT